VLGYYQTEKKKQMKTTQELNARLDELTRLRASLAQWHNRKMSKKDREFFAAAYREEVNQITEELIKRDGE
jgi:hypothetical protein